MNTKFLSAIAVTAMLSATPALAQDTTQTGDTNIIQDILDAVGGVIDEATQPTDGTQDPAQDPNMDMEMEDEDAPEGNFSRDIPPGLKANLTDEEIAEYEARLAEATTPQERNEIRRELQRKAQERHREQVQDGKKDKADKGSKGKDKSKDRGGKDKDRGGKDRGGKGK